MRYESLHELIRKSRSSRRIFLSLPVALQIDINEHGNSIHSAAELHGYIYKIQKHNRAVEISNMLFKNISE